MSAATGIGEYFSRVADDYELHAAIQASLGERLLERIARLSIAPNAILDVGCGTGKLGAGLQARFGTSRVSGVDISHGMARVASAKGIDSLVADASHLPFRAGAFELVVSNAAYQWVSDLAGAFREARRVLKEGGLFVLSCFGARTLSELRRCFGIVESPLPSTDLIARGLRTSGFSTAEIEVELRREDFASLIEMLYWLKRVGANRIASNRPFLTPRKLARLNEHYCRTYRRDGKVYATFEVIWATARR